MKMLINLNHVSDVKKFIQVSQSCTAEVLLSSGKYVVDARSILGIFSLDLSNPISVLCADENDYPKFKEWQVTAVGGVE